MLSHVLCVLVSALAIFVANKLMMMMMFKCLGLEILTITTSLLTNLHYYNCVSQKTRPLLHFQRTPNKSDPLSIIFDTLLVKFLTVH